MAVNARETRDYLLHGMNHEGKVTVYLGMSTTNMRSRIRSHHVDPRKNWFGVLFAIPLASPLLCRAIEAELIAEFGQAGAVDVIANVASESQMLDSDDVHVEPAVGKIRDALQLLLGADIFAAVDVAEPVDLDQPIDKVTPLTRAYRDERQRSGAGRTASIRRRRHTVGSASVCMPGGGSKATTRINTSGVFNGSQWRTAKPNSAAANFGAVREPRVLGCLIQRPATRPPGVVTSRRGLIGSSSIRSRNVGDLPRRFRS